MIAPFTELFAEYAAEEAVGLLRARPDATATFLEAAAAKAYNAALIAGGGLATYYGVKEIERYEADQAKKKFTKRPREGGSGYGGEGDQPQGAPAYEPDPDLTQPVVFDPEFDVDANGNLVEDPNYKGSHF